MTSSSTTGCSTIPSQKPSQMYLPKFLAAPLQSQPSKAVNKHQHRVVPSAPCDLERIRRDFLRLMLRRRLQLGLALAVAGFTTQGRVN